MELSDFDKKLLNELQGNLPICSHPFAELAVKLDSTEENVICRIQQLKQAGYLRRVGAFFDSVRLGYKGVLVALRVKDEYIEKVAAVINAYTEITHNYEREGDYNLWFTLLTRTAEREQEILESIGRQAGVEELRQFYSQRKFKINVKLKLK